MLFDHPKFVDNFALLIVRDLFHMQMSPVDDVEPRVAVVVAPEGRPGRFVRHKFALLFPAALAKEFD